MWSGGRGHIGSCSPWKGYFHYCPKSKTYLKWKIFPKHNGFYKSFTCYFLSAFLQYNAFFPRHASHYVELSDDNATDCWWFCSAVSGTCKEVETVGDRCASNVTVHYR